jgi:iron complex transport system substrate-binding protein
LSETMLRQSLLVSRRIPAVIASMVLAMTLAGCSTSTSEGDAPRLVTITASDLPLPAPAAAVTSDQRIIALANGSAEIVYALGFGGALVGRDIASTFPGSDAVPIVTSAHSVSAEKVLAQRPTLVIIDGRTGPKEALDQVRAAGVAIREVPEAWTLSDMPARITGIGAILGVPQAAAALNASDATAISSVAARADGVRVAFLYLRGTSSIYLLGGRGSGADALLAAIGAIDVGAAAKLNPFTPLTSEALIAAKPDVLLVMRKGLESVGGVEGLVALPGVAQTPAGANRRVVAVDDEVLLAFGPRTGALLAALAAAIESVRK